MRAAGLIVVALAATACRTELNLERGRRYACARDAGLEADGGTDQCAAGFRCGLDGYCFDPDAGEPRACEGPLDCSTGWRCGLRVNAVGACQPIGVGAAYPCVDDSWCESGWRCGPAGVCLDATNDALVAPSGRAGPAVTVSPAPFEVRGLGAGVLEDDEWQVISLAPSAAQVLHVGPREVWAQRLSVDGGLFAVRARDVIAIADDRGTTFLGPITSQGALLAPIAFPGFRPTGLAVSPDYKQGNVPQPELLIAWSPTSFAAWNLGSANLEPLGPPPGAVAAMDWWPTPTSRTERSMSRLVAATRQGVFELVRGDTWRPLPRGKCETQFANTPSDVRYLGHDRVTPLVGALFTAGDGGAPCGTLYGRLSDGGLEVTAEDTVCEPGATATGLRLTDSDGTRIWIQCRAADGLLSEVALCAAMPCVASQASPAPGRARARAADVDVIIDELGFTVRQQLKDIERPVFGSSVGTFGVERDQLVSVTRGADGGLELVARRPATDDGGRPTTELASFTHLSSFGFARAPHAGADERELPLMQVAGWPGLRVLPTGEIRAADDPTPVASFQPIRPLEGDLTAVGRKEPDGGFLYVSSFDALFAGPINATAPMALRLVPASRSAITSLAAAPGPETLPDGGVVQRWGYVVAQGRLFRFESRNRVWRSDEIELPELAVTVWFDGRRARVGTSTGRVFGLPTRVPLSEPLPGTASAFVSVCGHAFTATSAGVFTLERSDAGLATWRLHEGLAAALPRGAGAGLPGDGLRLFELDAELVAVNADGVVASLTFDCGGSP